MSNQLVVSGSPNLDAQAILNKLCDSMTEQGLTVQFQHSKSWKTWLMELSIGIIPLIVSYQFVFKPMLGAILKPDKDTQSISKAQGDEMKKHLIEKSRLSGKTSIPELTQMEETLLSCIVFPHEINATFDDIGGLNDLKHSIYESVILPLQSPELFQSLNNQSNKQSNLLQAPKGVLFYGPPGTG